MWVVDKIKLYQSKYISLQLSAVEKRYVSKKFVTINKMLSNGDYNVWSTKIVCVVLITVE